jgi:BON domain-containing protein
MTDRYSERTGQRWDDEERRPYESRFRERDWGYGGRDRGFMERAGDEVRSWFGDEEAQRRRMADEREEPWRGRGDWGWRESRGRSDWGREPSDRDWSRQWGYVEGRSGGYGDRPSEWSGRGYGSSAYGERPSEWSGRGYGSAGYGYSGSGMGYGGYGTGGRQRDWDREQPWGGQGPGGFGSYGRESEWSRRGDWARYAGLASQRERSMTGPHYGRGPRNYQRSDDRIREDVCERLSQHSYLDPSDVEIRVQNGEVTLQGHVEDRWAKRTVEEIAEGVSGVKEVHNHLRITQSPGGQEGEREGEPRSTGQQRSNWAA